jgi:hypothetical protein
MIHFLQAICYAGTSRGIRLGEDPSGHKERRQPIKYGSADPAVEARIMFPIQIISQATLAR